MFEVQQLGLGLGQHDVAGDSPRLALEALAEVRIPLMSHRPVILVSFSTGFSASETARKWPSFDGELMASFLD
jgi:hypothetical protein